MPKSTDAVSVETALAEAGARLAKAGIEAPIREARALLAHAAGLPPATLLAWPEREIAPAAHTRLAALVTRRAAGEPLSRIRGQRGFWTLDLSLGPETLDPRPDTETLVEAVLARVPDRTARLLILDLGTGSGAILLALLAEFPNALGVGIDRSFGALIVARDNASKHGLGPRSRFVQGDWAAALGAPFDVVVSNPPYIPTGEIATLAPEVRWHDPLAALDGGPDGLDAYRRIAPALPHLVRGGGVLALEVGQGQSQAVAGLLASKGFEGIEIKPDLAGIARAVSARQP